MKWGSKLYKNTTVYKFDDQIKLVLIREEIEN